MHPRLTDAEMRELPGPGTETERRRQAMTKLARRRRAPGLLAFDGDEVVGWVAVAPRTELTRIDKSRATFGKEPGKEPGCRRFAYTT